MDLRKIKKLIELVEESGISELEVKSGDEAIRIARPLPGNPNGSRTQSAPEQPTTKTNNVVRAPMAGTCYAAPEPGADPFVRVGQRVEVGDVVCIIESMKMMNEITVQVAGIVVAIDVANGEAVASEQVLIRLS